MNKKGSEAKTIELIEKLEKIVKNRPFELARLYQLKAQIYLAQNKYKEAISYYNKAISLKKLQYREHLSILYDMATLYLLQNNLKKSSELVDQLFYLADNIIPAFYILKASILVEQKKDKEALVLVMRAINSTKNPKENWLAFATALNIKMENYLPAAKLLIKLTASYPDKKTYWKQLSAVYLNIKKDDQALATLDLAYKLDFLETQKEILHLASLLMYQGLSFKAAHLIKKSMDEKKVKLSYKNYEILGDCWLRAEEITQALVAYKKASAKSEDGKIFAKIGRIHMSQRNWQGVVDNFIKSLEKGGIKKPEYTYISIGIAHLNLENYETAIQFFEKVIATETKRQLIKTARQWIDYTKSVMSEKSS